MLWEVEILPETLRSGNGPGSPGTGIARRRPARAAGNRRGVAWVSSSKASSRRKRRSGCSTSCCWIPSPSLAAWASSTPSRVLMHHRRVSEAAPCGGHGAAQAGRDGSGGRERRTGGARSGHRVVFGAHFSPLLCRASRSMKRRARCYCARCSPTTPSSRSSRGRCTWIIYCWLAIHFQARHASRCSGLDDAGLVS